MAVLRAQLQWFGNKGKDDGIPINFNKINIRIATELKNNMMTINLRNMFGTGTSRYWVGSDGKIRFQVDDKFKIFAKYDRSNSGLDLDDESNDLLFVGDLREIKSRVDEKNANIELKCTDRTFNLLNGLWTYAYRADDSKVYPNSPYKLEGWTSPTIIQHVIRSKSWTDKYPDTENEFIYDSLGRRSPPFFGTRYLIDARLKSEGGFIQDNRTVTLDKLGNSTTRTDFGIPDTTNSLFPTVPVGTRNYNFPLKNYPINSKPVYEILLETSQLDFTNTNDELNPDNTTFSPVIKRAMRFYIDEKNRFHWFYPSDTIDTDKFGNSQTITMGTTTNYEVKNHDFEFVIYDVINYVYFQAGKDMNGNTIANFVYDKSSGAPVFKDAKRLFPTISQKMKEEDNKELHPNEGNIVPDPTKRGGYAFPTSYSPAVVPAWNKNISVTSDAQYNQEFKNEAVNRGKRTAQKVISQASSQRWKGKLEFTGINLTIGDLMQYTSVAGGLSQEKLRYLEINHNIDKNGWHTNVNAENDEKELVV